MNNFMQSEFSSVPVAFHPAGTSLLISDTQPDQNPKAANAGAPPCLVEPGLAIRILAMVRAG